MLTILHPQLYQQILSYPIGIMAAPDPERGNHFLIVKATKEFLLAAKISGFIKVYVCPAELGGRDTLALVFAFYDDEDEPLIIRTPLVDDVESRHLLATLTSPLVNVHFFDEHGREFLVYEAELDLPKVDVPPILSSTSVWSPIPYPEEIGREETLYRGTDHWLPARS
ncbi:hypothetical protein [Xanthomonas citri]|uniref:hypothetical protein n=1 Tax=Xanthomonas citri TaxID=346 RepID=UPI001C05D2C1|nr:hypothetical protein [Xanthomonas citri]